MCLSPICIPIKCDVGNSTLKTMLVPCQKCVECLQDRQNAWIYRIFSEQQHSAHSLFVTLTYDVANVPLVLYNGKSEILPYREYVKRKSIVDCELTLYPRDLMLFFKRLRKNTGANLKYFACGEYGDTDARPHYHFALFYDNCSPEKMEAEIDKCWNKGFTEVACLIANRIEYLTKYVTDKVLFTKRKPIQVDYFNRSSKGLGIDGFFEDEKHYGVGFKTTMLQNGTIIPIPRYFRKKFYPKTEFSINDYLEQNEVITKKRDVAIKRLQQDRKIQCGSEPFEESFQRARDRIDDKRRQLVLSRNKRRKKDF